MEQKAEMSGEQWIATFCRLIGIDPPSHEETEALLELADAAANSSPRAAPLACWAAGRSGRPASDLQRIADTIHPSR